MGDGILRVLICGGGNGAHVLAGLASSRPKTEVTVMSLFADEAERWSKIAKDNDFVIDVTNNDGSRCEIKGKPKLVTKDPALAMKGADIIIFTVPAFAHEQYFIAIGPYVVPNTVIIGLPGQAGFEFQALDVLKDKARQCAIVSLESLPWACRILEFGKKVQVLGFKESLGAAVISHVENPVPPLGELQFILGEKPVAKPVQNYIALNLMAKSIIHPPLMYGMWRGWNGKPLDAPPAFYQGVDEFQAKMLSGISEELIKTAKEIEKKRPGIDNSEVIHIFDWYKTYYREQISDDSCLMSAMRTNKAYDGLVHPTKKTPDGKFVPDFTYRYMAEDVPYGLVVMKGIAQIAGVKTPIMDEVIMWCQEKMGKEYLVGSELKGKDLNMTRAPQKYGFHTMDSIFNI